MRGDQKLNDFNFHFIGENYSCICITETWLKDHIDDKEILSLMSDYIVYRNDRNFAEVNKKDGGGTLIAVKKCLFSTEIDCSVFGIESSWVKLAVSSNTSILLGCIYLRPPVSYEVIHNLDACLDYIYQVHVTSNDSVILCGDFNLSDLKQCYPCTVLSYEGNSENPENPAMNALLDDVPAHFSNIKLSPPSEYFLEILNEHSLKQIVNFPTHEENLLDLVCVNSNFQCSTSKTEAALPTSKHVALKIIINVMILKVISQKKERVYNYKRIDVDLAKELFSSIDWQSVFCHTEINQRMEAFYELLFQNFNLCVPKATIKPFKYPPWFDRELIALNKQKNRVHSFNNTFKDDSLSKDKHKFLRTEFNKLKKCKYADYNAEIELALRTRPKKFWSINKLRSKNGGVPSSMFLNDMVVETPEEVANLFALHFQSVYQPISVCQPGYFNGDVDNMICSIVFSESEILNIIKSLDITKGCGPDKIPTNIIKLLADFLVHPLTEIFNLSLATGCFPDSLKVGHVIPLHKSNDKHDIQNYRPITMLNVFSKILETAVLMRLKNHFCNYLSTNQHGFLNNKSTVTNLVALSQTVSKAVNNEEQVDVCYLDFSKAFDKVDHNFLLYKLQALGIAGNLISWFRSYLVGRSNRVCISGHYSDKYEPSSGVAQGSIDGPFLFLIFINDLVKEITHAQIEMYADDVKLIMPIKKMEDCVNLQNDLKATLEWCKRWRLTLNPIKCQMITYTLKTKPIVFNYELDSIINRVNSVHDLGVSISSNFNFSSHVSNMVRSAFKIFGLLKRRSVNFHQPETILTLYKTLVRNRLEYASVLWNSDCKTAEQKIERVQKKFVKFFCYKFKIQYTSTDYYNQCLALNLPTLSQRRIQLDMMFLHKLVNHKYECPNLLENLQFRIPSCRTRNKDLFYAPFNRVNVSRRSPLNRLMHEFNMLSRDINKIDIALPENVFRKYIMEFILDPSEPLLTLA